jgi:hypothetical protein
LNPERFVHVLRQQIARVRRQARRLLLLHAAAWIIGVAVAVALGLVLVDFFARFDGRGFRVALTVAAVCAICWTIYRFLVPALRQPMDDVHLARRVERRYPELTDRLSSSLNFLDQAEDDPQAGSSELRRAVIAEAAAEVEHLNWTAVLNRGPALVATAAAGVVLILGAALVFLRPAEAKVGLSRLVAPWNDVAWPRTHRLALREPVTRLAKGDDFEVAIIDLNGELPDDLQIVYRSLVDDEPSGEEEERPLITRGAAVARRQGVTRPFEYRAVGGDDHTMPWTAVEVLEPPRVASIEIMLHEPPYTARPPRTSERRIEALRGSTIALHGRTTKPTVAANVRQENGPSVPLQITEEGFAFRLDSTAAKSANEIEADPETAREWIVDQSGKYWIELTDADGLVGGHDDAWDVKALPDAPPHVVIERPTSALFVTPNATVKLRVAARDDLALREVGLQYLRSDQTGQGEQRVVLFSGPERLSSDPGPSIQYTELTSRSIDYDWELAPLALKPGTQITAAAVAMDYLPQAATSQPIRITVLTPAEFEERIATRQAALIAEIARILALQRATHAQTQQLARQAEQVGEFRGQEIDAVHSAELGQRQIRRSLASPGEGVLVQAASLIDELRANRIDNQDSLRCIEQVQAEIRRLESNKLPAIEQNLLAVSKSQLLSNATGGDSQKRAATFVAPLQEAVAGQDHVVSTLEALLEQLQEWTSVRAIHRDIAQIQRDQAELETRARTIQPATLGKDRKDLSAQELTDLESMSNAQNELGRRFDKLLQRMDQARAQLQETTPLVADTLGDAIQIAHKRGIASQMREAARHVEGNQLGQAIDDQTAVGQKLAELADILSGRRENETARLIKKLREAEQRLENLRSKQDALLKLARQLRAQAETDAGGKQQDEIRRELMRLAREQRELHQDAKGAARELERLQAQRAADRIASAGEKLDRGGQAAEQGAADKTADLAEEAKRDLDEAQRELVARRRQAEQDLANEQLVTIRDALAGLVDRQKNVVEQTKRLETLRDADGGLKPQHIESTASLAREQQSLHAEAVHLAEQIASAPVFQLALQSAAEQMMQAANLLLRRITGDQTQRAAEHALTRLTQLQAALAEDPKSSGESQNSQDGNAGAQPQLPPGQLPILAELKLLKVMQEDVYQRTVQLRESLGERPPNQAEARQLQSLASEQGRIAELVGELTARADAMPKPQPALVDPPATTDGD